MRRYAIFALVVSALAFSAPLDASLAKPEREPDIFFLPTPHEVVDVMLKLAEVKENDVVYDLGCGDGRIVIAAAKKAGARAYGFDIDPAMVKKSIENVKKAGVEDLVTIKEKDIFKLDLSEATVVTLYLLPALNVKLMPQLEKLKPGSRIVSHDFDMRGVQPDVEATLHLENGELRKVYLWTTPLKKIDPEPEEHSVIETWEFDSSLPEFDVERSFAPCECPRVENSGPAPYWKDRFL